MNSKWRFRLCRSICVFATCVLGIVTSVFAESAGARPTEFIGDLLQKHAALLSTQGRTSLDEINRQLREAETQVRKAVDPTARGRARKRRAEVISRLAAMLDGCASVHRVSIDDNKVSSSLAGPFMFASDEGGLLFRLGSGIGEVGFSRQEIEESRAEGSGTIEIEWPRKGVVWLLIGLEHLPVDETALPVEIKRVGHDPIKTRITVITPRTGVVRITALDDDRGLPTPVMIRITSKATGRDRPPSNAVNFEPLFDGNGNPSGHRETMLPGRLGGEWWCVPAPFDMALPAGDYDIVLRRGIEYLPVFDQFTVTAGGLVERLYHLDRWVDMRSLGWYSGDDHVHTRITSDDDAERVMAWAKAEDVHVINVLKMGDIYRTFFEERGWGKTSQVSNEDYLLIPGQECPRTWKLGHAIALNTVNMIRNADKYFLYDWVADSVHAQGGLFGYAHVVDGSFNISRDMSINVPKGKADFAEILQFASANSVGTELWYEFLNLGFKLAASAGSDVPWGGTIGEARMYALLGKQPFSGDAWFEAVRRGHTFVTDGPMIEFQVDHALPGDEIEAPDREKLLHIRARTWYRSNGYVPMKLAVVRDGEVLREAVSSDPNANDLSLDFTVPADDGFWIAARVDADDGASAHTTPIYVVRPGLRFWKFNQVAELIEKRLRSLSEIEKMIAAAPQKAKTGTLHDSGYPSDHMTPEEQAGWEDFISRGDALVKERTQELRDEYRILGLEGPELLKRVDEARKIYDNLLQVAKREKPRRDPK